jgi:prepilin signal peptidase PulO-like enzyme (type II secretory pathway)
VPDSLTATRRSADHRIAALSVVASAVVAATAASAASVGAAIAIVVLAHAARVDARTHRIPNGDLALAGVALAGAAVVSGSPAPSTVAVTSAVWGGSLLALHLFDRSLGFGDVKLGFVLGALLGLVGHAADFTLPAVLLASAITFVAGAVIALRSSLRTGGATPFAPGLVFACAAVAVVISVTGAIS